MLLSVVKWIERSGDKGLLGTTVGQVDCLVTLGLILGIVKSLMGIGDFMTMRRISG